MAAKTISNMSPIPTDLDKWFSENLIKQYLQAEDEAILHGCYIQKPKTYRWLIHGIGYNDHYNAVMSYFSSHELNILKHNEIYVYKHIPINKSTLFNLGIGIGTKLKKRLIYADQIGLIKLF